MLRAAILFALLASLAGCAVQPSKTVDVAQLQKFEASVTTRTIEVSKLLFALPEGKAYGKPHGGLACFAQPALVWRGGSSAIAEGPFIAKVSGVLSASGLRLTQERDQLFSTPDKQSELVLAGKVVNVDFTTCGEGTFTGRKGSAYVSVEWEIFSRIDNRVVASFATEGSFLTEQFKPSNSWVVFVSEALEAATRNLVANDKFREVLLLKPATASGARPA